MGWSMRWARDARYYRGFRARTKMLGTIEDVVHKKFGKCLIVLRISRTKKNVG